MSRLRRTLLLAILLLGCSRAAGQPAPTPARVADLALAGWNQVKQRVEQIEHIHVRSVNNHFDLLAGANPARDKPAMVETTVYKKTGPWVSFAEDRAGTPLTIPGLRFGSTSLAAASNSRYMFALQKKPEDKGWLLSDIQMRSEPLPARTGREIAALQSGNPRISVSHLVRHFRTESYQKQTFAEEVAAREVKIVAVEAVPGPKPMVRAEYRRVKGDSGGEPNWVVLDPEANYCIAKSALFVSFGKMKLRGTIEYDYEPVDGVPLMKGVVDRLDATEGGNKVADIEKRMTVKIVGREPIGEEEFTLSAFGLPEPSGTSWPRRTPPYVWVIGGAAVLFVLALALRYLSSRAKQKQAVP